MFSQGLTGYKQSVNMIGIGMQAENCLQEDVKYEHFIWNCGGQFMLTERYHAPRSGCVMEGEPKYSEADYWNGSYSYTEYIGAGWKQCAAQVEQSLRTRDNSANAYAASVGCKMKDEAQLQKCLKDKLEEKLAAKEAKLKGSAKSAFATFTSNFKYTVFGTSSTAAGKTTDLAISVAALEAGATSLTEDGDVLKLPLIEEFFLAKMLWNMHRDLQQLPGEKEKDFEKRYQTQFTSLMRGKVFPLKRVCTLAHFLR